MSNDDYVVQNIYRYSRKSYKKNNSDSIETYARTRREDATIDVPESPRTDRIDSPGCSCDIDPEGEIANILHKKCPVIALAQQQLQKLLDETDRILCDNTRCCRSAYDFLLLCQQAIFSEDKCRWALVILILIFFIIGLILGAASCGTYLRKYNSPILNCIDNFFLPSYLRDEDSSHVIV